MKKMYTIKLEEHQLTFLDLLLEEEISRLDYEREEFPSYLNSKLNLLEGIQFEIHKARQNYLKKMQKLRENL